MARPGNPLAARTSSENSRVAVPAGILPVGRLAQQALPDEIIEHDLTGRDAQPEQACGLAEVQPEAWHFLIHAEDHGFQLATRGLADSSIALTDSPLEGLGLHERSAVRRRLTIPAGAGAQGRPAGRVS